MTSPFNDELIIKTGKIDPYSLGLPFEEDFDNQPQFGSSQNVAFIDGLQSATFLTNSLGRISIFKSGHLSGNYLASMADLIFTLDLSSYDAIQDKLRVDLL